MLLISLIYSLFFLSLLFLRINFFIQYYFFGLPRSLSGKESASNAGNMGSYPRLVRSPGGGHGNPLQYSCLGNPMDTGAWWIRVHGVTKSQTWLRDWAHACRHHCKFFHVVTHLILPQTPWLDLLLLKRKLRPISVKWLRQGQSWD